MLDLGKLNIISTLFVLTTLTTISTAISCPTVCKCSWVLDSLEVDCSSKGLINYPNFEGMPIEHLILADNNFVEFPSQLSTIDALIYLDLSNNKIEFIDSNALLGFLSLRTLILANNSITNWQNINPNMAFTHAVSLQHLSLSGNQLSKFNYENPTHILISESLNWLELKNCGITDASGDVILNGLPNLERLILSDNSLTAMSTLPSRSLRVLELSNCDLQRVNTYFLEGLPNLEALNLSWNYALQLGSKLGDVIFSDSLNELDASFCNLDTIDLSGLPVLTKLRLRGNMLRSVTSATFGNNTQLERLDLARNSLRVLEGESFSKLKRLTQIDLSYNEIARFDRNIFRANDNLVTLNLSRNVIERLTKFVSNSLSEINLSWCEIISIDATALTGLSAIKRLDLSNNPLRDFPAGMQSQTLKELNLSNCKLSNVRNTTFREFPELASLWLNGNRFTNPFPATYFRSNKYLDQIWVGDNPWICHCQDETFIDFYDFLTASPQKLYDKNHVRCASPAAYYGKTWEAACIGIWVPNANSTGAEKVWTTILLSIFVIGILLFCFSCFKRYMLSRKQRNDRDEYQRNQDEMRQIRRENARMLEEEGRPNAPQPYETNLPSYEDALLMPKLERPVKSMLDLTASARARKKLQRARTNPEEDAQDYDDELVIDNSHRFRSEEMLSNRDKERTAPMGPHRRTGVVEHNNSGTRRFSIEDSRFAPAHMKSQNLQSAEKISNFQSYENSPYSKRKPKIAEIPPFKRATLRADSVEFLTDPEFDAANSKPSSPFARRKPRGFTPQVSHISSSTAEKTSRQASIANLLQDCGARLDPAIEDYFGKSKSAANSTDGSDFHVVVEPDVDSLPDVEYSSTDGEINLKVGKRKKRKNSINRRSSGNYNAVASANAGGDASSSDSEPIVVVHKPMKETLF